MLRSAIVLGALLAASAAYAFTPPFLLNEVAPGDYVHLGKNVNYSNDQPDHDDIANLGLIVGEKCAAVVDTGGSVTVGKAFKVAIRKITQLPICYVINTHWHPDHIFGNIAFKAPGTVFVGHVNLPAEMQEHENGLISAHGYDLGQNANDAFVPPTLVVKIGHPQTLDLGGRKLLLRAWPPAHTDTDVTVLDEKTQTLFTGDLLFRKRIPVLDGNLDDWLKVIGTLGQEQAKVVVPGHGPVGDNLKADLAPEQHYLKQLRDETCAYIHNGGDSQDAPEKVLAGKGKWLLWKQDYALNVTRTYTELNWSCFP